MDFFSGVWSWATGSSFSAALARTALVGYVAKLIAGNTDPSTPETAKDTGVRLQLDPSTENEIPVLYGEAYFGGNITDAVLSSDYKKMTYCLTLSEITGNRYSDGQPSSYTFNDVYFNNNRVVFKADGVTVDYTQDSIGNQDPSMRDLVKVYFYAQTPLQPVGYSGTTPVSYTVMPGWTQTTHTMPGLIYAIVEVTYNKDKNVSGLPECIFHVTNSTSLAGDVLVDYMKSTVYGAGIPANEINSSFTALNAYCSAGFTYTDANATVQSGIIDINGLVDPAQTVLDNMETMARAASSWLSYDIHSGQWNVVINKAGTSIASITDANILGDITISGTSLTQLSNAADVKYQNTNLLDNSDFVKINIPENELFQNEPTTTMQMDLPFTNKQIVAMKIGLQALKQARVDKVISFKTDYSYINLQAGDLIDITSSVYGFTNKVFRVITASEIDDNDSIQCELKCLEYDATVYDYDITEYDVITDNGILSIGSIGKPNVPSVTKTEQANVPKIVINAVVPSGIVDAIEYWITFDTTVLNDAARTYVKIGTFSNTGGSLLAENSTASYTYSGLSQSDFLVKVRGINNVTAGPFSDPSGVIAYVPIVVADTISDSPVSIGGQVMGLGLLTLLNNMDKLFSGDTSAGGVFDSVFKGFKNVTGIDLVGQAEGGTLVVAGSGLIDGLTDVDTSTVAPAAGNLLGWDGVNWVPVDPANITTGGSGGTGGGGATPCFLTPSVYFPIDRTSYKGPLPQVSSDLAPITGDYYIRFSGEFGAPLSKGTGNIKLFKSDGTLVQTVAASAVTIDNNIMKVSFNERAIGIDYYILMDAGVVTYNGCLSPAITDSTTWNFHTGNPITTPPVTPPVSDPPKPALLPPGCGVAPIINNYFTTNGTSAPVHTKVHVQSNIVIEFNIPIVKSNSGTISIKKVGVVDTFHQTFNLAYSFSSNKTSTELVTAANTFLSINPTKDFDPGATYYITMTAGCVKDACGTQSNAAITSPDAIRWTIDAGPTASASPAPASKEVSLGYDRPVVPGTGTIEIKDPSGTTIQTVQPTDPEVSSIKD
jgi:hypothetical protein